MHMRTYVDPNSREKCAISARVHVSVHYAHILISARCSSRSPTLPPEILITLSSLATGGI
jgi:hypothetical protein